MSEILKPVALTIDQFMRSGDYALCKRVPRNQRAYEWGKDTKRDEVEDFLHDIGNAMQKKAASYFIGAMVCVERGESEDAYHEIVDGQQRLTTLSIIFAVAYHFIDDNETQWRNDLKSSSGAFKDKLLSFLYYGDDWSDETSLDDRPYRLELGDSDRMQYRQVIKHGPGSQSGPKYRCINDAYNATLEFFKAKVDEFGMKWIKEFISFIATKVRLIGVIVDDEADAYEIFEVLNDRNLPLSAVDLIKNKLLSCFSGTQQGLDNAYGQWRSAFIVLKEHPGNMQEYVRCHMQMREGGKIDPKGLYRHLRRVVGDKRKEAKSLLDDFEKHCHKFSAMLGGNGQFWEQNKSGAMSDDVLYLKNYRVVYTLMFSMLYVGKPWAFIRDAYRIMAAFMKRTRAVRDRLSIIDYYEEQFAELAHKFQSAKGPKTPQAFFAEIKRIDSDGWQVVPDKNFVDEMSRRRVKDSNAKAMLLDLANHLQKKATTVKADEISVEHILPQHPRTYEEWPDFEDQEVASLYLDKIGNLTLLEKRTENPTASNRKFADKKRLVYTPEKCGIVLTNELCNYDEWTRKVVDERSVRLAKLAAEVWSFKEFK